MVDYTWGETTGYTYTAGMTNASSTTTNQFEDTWWSTSTGTTLTTATWELWTTHLTVEPVRPSPAEQFRIDADRARRREENRRRLAEAQREHEEITARAEALLREHLTGSQLVEFDDSRVFTVKAEGRVFRLRLHDTVREYEVDGDGFGRCLASYCIHHTDGTPSADTLLAQKLLIETDLAELERIANVTRYDRRTPANDDDLDEDQMEDPAA